MKKTIISALLILGLSLSYAEEPAKKSEPSLVDKMKQKLDKPTKAKEEKAPPAAKKDTASKKSASANELSDSDKALKAHGEKEADKLSSSQKSALLQRLNSGTDAELEAIPGVGEKRAKNIKKARPLADVPALIMVDDIGEVTYDGIIKWAKDGMTATTSEKKEPKTAKKETAEKPATEKKTAKKETAAKTADKKEQSAEKEENPLKRLFGKKDKAEDAADSKTTTKPAEEKTTKAKSKATAEAKPETVAKDTPPETAAKPKRTPKAKKEPTVEKKAE
jgi:DNA uptake protein ComE-like DNA-binding protein